MNLNGVPRMDVHSHSEYSNLRLIDSINRPRDMILTAHKLGMSGIVLTDHESISGHVKWLNEEKDLKKNGLIPSDFKCGCGNEIYLVDNREKGIAFPHFILIAKDAIGHRQLKELSSIAWMNSYYDRRLERVPTTKADLKRIVKKNPGHLIATTDCNVVREYIQYGNIDYYYFEGQYFIKQNL